MYHSSYCAGLFDKRAMDCILGVPKSKATVLLQKFKKCSLIDSDQSNSESFKVISMLRVTAE
jgi:hypothetical protein